MFSRTLLAQRRSEFRASARATREFFGDCVEHSASARRVGGDANDQRSSRRTSRAMRSPPRKRASRVDSLSRAAQLASNGARNESVLARPPSRALASAASPSINPVLPELE